MRRKTILAFLLLLSLAFVLPFAGVAAAHNDDVTMQITPYFGGMARNGNWVLARVIIHNSGSSAFQGELGYAGAWLRGRQTFSFRKKVAVPANDTLQFTFYFIPDNKDLYGDNVVLALLTGKNNTLLVTKVKVPLQGVLDDAHRLGAAVGFAPSTLGLPAAGEGSPPVWYWSPLPRQDFPTRLAGLSSVSTLLLNNDLLAQFTDVQMKTLLDWVYSGGTLLLNGDPAALASLPDGMRPVDSAGSSTSLPGRYLATWAPGRVAPQFSLLVYGVRAAANAKTLLSAGRTPLIVRRDYGAGATLYIAFPLTKTPLADWEGASTFWAQLLKRSGARAQPIAGMNLFQGNYTSLLSRVAGETMPSMSVLFLLFFVYLLLVGPGCYLCLKRWRRLEYAWLLVPLLTLLFSGATYGASQLKRRGPPHWSQFALVYVNPGRGQAYVYGNAALLSREKGSVDLSLGRDMLVAPAANNSGYAPAGIGRAAVIWREGDTPSLTLSTQQRWGAVAVRFAAVSPFSTTVAPPQPLLQVSPLTFDTGRKRWSGLLTNRLPTTLASPVLVVGRQVYLFGDVPSGGHLDWTALRQHGWIENDLANALLPPPFHFRPTAPVLDASQQLWLRFSLLQPFYNRADMVVKEPLAAQPSGGLSPKAYLAGWTSSPWPPVQLIAQKQQPAVRALTAFVVPVALQSEAGPLRILNSTDFSASVLASQANANCGTPERPRRAFPPGAWQMQVAYHALHGTQKPLLALDWKIAGVNNVDERNFKALHFYLFDWSAGQMIEFPLTANALVHIPDPVPYWQNGNMRAALQADDSWNGGCVGFDLQALEVAP